MNSEVSGLFNENERNNGPKTEQARLSGTARPVLQGNAFMDRVILSRIGPPGEICGLVTFFLPW